jgi:hypothetical protein
VETKQDCPVSECYEWLYNLVSGGTHNVNDLPSDSPWDGSQGKDCLTVLRGRIDSCLSQMTGESWEKFVSNLDELFDLSVLVSSIIPSKEVDSRTHEALQEVRDLTVLFLLCGVCLTRYISPND